jgi:hypothetical protein
MAERNDPRPGGDVTGAARLDSALAEEEGLLRAVSAVRGIGPVARDALEAVLGLKAVRQLQAMWAAWDAFCQASGVDADALLEDDYPAQICEIYTSNGEDAAEMVAAAYRLGFGVKLRSETVPEPRHDYSTIRFVLTILHDSPEVEE